MNPYFMPIYTTIVGAIIGFLIGKIKDLINKGKQSKQKEEEVSNALKEGMAILLRGKLHDYYNIYEHEDIIPTSEWEDIEQTHAVYNKLGGNHTGDRLFAELRNKHLVG